MLSVTTFPKTATKFISKFIKKQWGLFLIIQILSLAWTLDNTAWPWAFKLFIDKITYFSGDTRNIWHVLTPVLFLWGGLWILISVMFRLQGFFMAKAWPQLETNVRMTMFNYVKGHSYTYFSNHLAGSLSNKISDMTQSTTRIVQLVVTLFIPAGLAIVVASITFFTIRPIFGVLLLIWASLHGAICFFGGKRCSKFSKTHANKRSYLNGKIVDTLSNIINVKLFARQHFENHYINTFQTTERRAYYKALIEPEKMKFILDLSCFLLSGVLITWAIIYNWQHHALTIGDVVYLLNTNGNVLLLAWIAGLELPNLFKEIGICQQALSIVIPKHDIQDAKHAYPLHCQEASIEFKKVDFGYHEKDGVFQHLNISIAANSKVGLVGFSGSGKSTFVNLIMRFFDINKGCILIGGENIQNVTLQSLREHISMIPQAPSLFHRSLMDNIRYGYPNASHDEIIQAAKQAHCHDFIQQLPDGYDSLVGERGIKLSGGQRQRIAIARAILKKSPILILDEATSALDSVTEQYIQEGLAHLMDNRTTIVVAHRLSTLATMDRIIVFDQGKTIEDGTHEALIKKNKHYAKMWRMQAGGFLPDHRDEV